MTLLTARDMASYAHPRIGVWSATLRGIHFLYTSNRKFLVQVREDFLRSPMCLQYWVW